MTRTRTVGLLLALLGLVALAATGLVEPDVSRSPRPEATQQPPEASALRVLHEWDGRRADAYAAGAVGRLRGLYVVGSAVGAADARLLERYRARGLRVTSLRTQVLDLEVLRRQPRLLRLRVTDRVAGAVVRARNGTGAPVVLPRDAATRRTLVLMRGDDGAWRMSASSVG